MLRRLLAKVATLKTANLFTYSVVLVDNDELQSGKDVAVNARKQTGLCVDYDMEPERSISLARNRCVRNAHGELIAFIDDDEFPDQDWLLNHFRMLTASKADGVLGPVRSHFEGEAPAWLVKSGILERRSLNTGEVIRNSVDTRTGNVLIWKSVFTETGGYFDPKFGRSGGGDAVFFKRMMEQGKVFVWCNEACVFETVPPERQNRMYYLRRACTRGLGEAWETRALSAGTARSLAAIVLYTAALPVLCLLGQHLFMKYLVKDCDHIAKVLGYLGIRLAPERPYP